jgi:peptidyl-prolyl cis-trans isomerase C
MRLSLRHWLASLCLGSLTCVASAQAPGVPTSAKSVEKAPAPATNARSVAATVNGEPILEGALQRFLRRVPPERQTEARPAVINHLVDNILVDQYLQQAGIKVEAKEIDAKINEMKGEIKKEKLEYEKVLQEMDVTETELRYHLSADIRWEKYSNMQSTDKVLREMFTGQKELFDGSMVRVRHILLTPDSRDPQKVAAARASLVAVKKGIEDSIATGLAKLPQGTDNLAREKARVKLLEDAFSAQAKEKSQCPSKQQGGDVGWFDRAGAMVEPFSKAAFALKPFEMSDIVETQFGVHLILLLDRRPGKDIKFEDVKDTVKEVYAEKLRNLVVQHMKKSAKIVINAAPGTP